ncbi:MAG: hypothetical protein E7589_02835 [Ruminococcaceae bacterium]|nr:hypothetical protein [Oscillospiraceae bacterium]
MKMWKIIWGIVFILAAALIALDAVGVIDPLMSVMGEISVFSIVGTVLLVAWIVSRCIKGRVVEIFFPLGFIFMLLEGNIATVLGLESTNIIHNGLVLLISLLLTVGFGILFPPKFKKSKYHVEYEIDGDKEKVKKHKGRRAGGSLGSNTVYVDCTEFRPDIIDNDLGACVVHFENVEWYEGDKTLRISNDLGSMLINVPSSWRVVASVENNLGSVKMPEEAPEGEDAPVLFIDGENDLGSLTVRYV